MKLQGYILYLFYYGDTVVYLGRTKQPLQDRIRGHLFKKPMHRSIDINLVTKIEYALFPTEADMHIYEIYLINTLKPSLNVDDKTKDYPTIMLPDVDFKVFECHLWDKWKTTINGVNDIYQLKHDRYRSLHEEYSILRSKFRCGELTKEQCSEQIDLLRVEESELREFLYG